MMGWKKRRFLKTADFSLFKTLYPFKIFLFDLEKVNTLYKEKNVKIYSVRQTPGRVYCYFLFL